MLNSTFSINRYKFLAMVLVFCLALIAVEKSFAQNQPIPGTAAPAPVRPLGPTEDSVSPTYREPKKDPFFDERLLPKVTKAPVDKGKPIVVEIKPVAPPSFEERDAEWKRKREEARLHGQPEPSPSEKYLIDELKIMGLYSKADGKGVFMKPSTSATTMLFATTGQKFWNGSISRIDKDKIEVDVITLYDDKSVKHASETRNFTRGK